MREQGYYWTKKDGHWLINYFHGELWELLRDDTQWLRNDDYFDEIDENQITRPTAADSFEKLGDALRKQGFK